MKKKMLLVIGLSIMATSFTACGESYRELYDEADSYQGSEQKADNEDAGKERESQQTEQNEGGDDQAKENAHEDDIFGQFLAGEIEACNPEWEEGFKYTDLDTTSGEFGSYGEGSFLDLDNDNEDEYHLNGPYGGMILDNQDNKLVVLAQGEGTAGEMTYVTYQDKIWIVHSDTSHAGRETYEITRYNGPVAEETNILSAEYWDNENGGYDENSTFTYRGKTISMAEFEALRKEILGI